MAEFSNLPATLAGDAPKRGYTSFVGPLFRAQLAWLLVLPMPFLEWIDQPSRQVASWSDALMWGLGWCLLGALATAIVSPLIVRIHRSGDGTVFRVAKFFLVAAGATLLWQVFSGGGLLVQLFAEPSNTPAADPPTPITDLGFQFVFMVMWTNLFVALLATREAIGWRARRQELSFLERVSRLEALRGQLNPHFLFNALTSAIALIDESPPRAKDMIRRLSALLRRALAMGGEGSIALKEEIAFASIYLECEKVRFEDRLMVEVNLDGDVAGAQIAPLIVQPLVENAVKHGMYTSPSPLTVTISAARRGSKVEIYVTNTGHLGLHNAEEKGHGLRNIRERIALLYSSGGLTVKEDDGRVVAHLWYVPEDGATDPLNEAKEP